MFDLDQRPLVDDFQRRSSPEKHLRREEEAGFLPGMDRAKRPEDLVEVVQDPAVSLGGRGDELPGGVEVLMIVEADTEEFVAVPPVVDRGQADAEAFGY